jgi:hypothetical protein
MGSASSSGLMEIIIKVNSGLENATVRVKESIKMAATTTVNMKKTNLQVEEFINGLMARATKETGRMDFSTVKELRSSQMALFLMVCGTWAFQKASASANTLMEVNTMEIGLMVNLMAWARKPFLMVQHMMEDGLRAKLEAMELKYCLMELCSKVNGKNLNS